jgi:hypothetical protein
MASCVCFFFAGLGVLILYYCFVGTSSGFESFLDSQSGGVRFTTTTIGVIIKSYWTSLEKGISPTMLSGTKAADHFYQQSEPASRTVACQEVTPVPETQFWSNYVLMQSPPSS